MKGEYENNSFTYRIMNGNIMPECNIVVAGIEEVKEKKNNKRNK